MKKVLGLIAISSGLFLAKICYGVGETVFEWVASDTTALAGQIYQTFSDFKLLLVLVVGVPVGFIIIRKIIGTVKGGMR